MESSTPTFSGYRRQRKTRFSVRLGEILSRIMITLGGVGTIIAIVLVCIFLVWVVIPLFQPAKVEVRLSQAGNWKSTPLAWGIGSDQQLGWALLESGELSVFRIDNGETISSQQLFKDSRITAVSAPDRNPQLAVGFQNGSVQLGKITVESRLLDENTLPDPIKQLVVKSTAIHEGQILHRNAAGKITSYEVKAVFDPPATIAEGQAITHIDLSIRSNGPIFCSVSSDGVLRISEVTETKNLITGKVKKELFSGQWKIQSPPGISLPDYALVNGVGDNVFLIWKNGLLQRINTKIITEPKLVEEVKLVESNLQISAVQFMIGKASLLVGDTGGTIKAWFRIRPKDLQAGDQSQLVAAHEISSSHGSVVSLSASARSRVFAAGYADGTISLYNLTNDLHLADLNELKDQKPIKLVFAPKEDGLLAWSAGGLSRWGLQLGYPEISYKSLIRPIWYEGYVVPAHVWQSSSGDDAFEPKFGFWPLIFGTLKATFYSLIIGVPLALCAAIYTREFLHPRIRSVVKPTIEVMASLPSVVLGFLGALVIAPFVESIIATILAAFILVPTCFALGGFLWHTFPQKWQRWLQAYKWFFIILLLPVSLWLSMQVSPILENALFDGSFKSWLQKKDHKSASGWFILLIPLAAVATILMMEYFINPIVRGISKRLSGSRESYLNLLKFLSGVALTCLIAWAASQLLALLGFDPRTSFFGVYDQRNALVVGFMMGFAIIPIIYTLTEDALSSVPDHLRSASLGCGATIWQTTSRIVIPTAMSGIFSAVMVGLGRAVGETMIVLMSAGNMPVLDLNMFNGFRTLSANIAVELPEAVPGSAHYRTLFLAALTLFVFTFLLNTLAESMRQRVRKRAFEL